MRKITILIIFSFFLLLSNLSYGYDLAKKFCYPVDNYIGGSYYNRIVGNGHLGEDERLDALTPVYAICNGNILPSPVYGPHCCYGMVQAMEFRYIEDGAEKKAVFIIGHLSNRIGYKPHKPGEVKIGDIIGYIAHDEGLPPKDCSGCFENDENGDGSEHGHFGLRLGSAPYSNGYYWVYYGYYPNPGNEVPVDLGGKWTSLKNFLDSKNAINPSELDTYSGNHYPCHFPTGMLIRSPDGNYYVIKDGERCWISNEAIIGWKFNPNKAIEVDERSLLWLREGESITTYPEITVYKYTPSPNYYVKMDYPSGSVVALKTESLKVLQSWGIEEYEVQHKSFYDFNYFSHFLNASKMYFYASTPVLCPQGVGGYQPNAVFQIDENGIAHPIFNEDTYYAWYPGWDWVIAVDSADEFLKGISGFGDVVYYRYIMCGDDYDAWYGIAIGDDPEPAPEDPPEPSLPIILSAPSNVQVFPDYNNVVFKFDPVPGADGYQINLEDDSMPGGTTQPYISIISVQPSTNYTFKLRAVHHNSKGRVDACSEWLYFDVFTERERPIVPREDKNSIIINYSFENANTNPWTEEDHHNAMEVLIENHDSCDGRFSLMIKSQGGLNFWEEQLKTIQYLRQGIKYRYSFCIKTDIPSTYLFIGSCQDYYPYTTNGLNFTTISATDEWQHYQFDFTADFDEPNNRITFYFGHLKGTIWIDNVKLIPVDRLADQRRDLLQNGDLGFGILDGWIEEDHNDNASIAIKSFDHFIRHEPLLDNFCIKVINGQEQNYYDVQLKQIFEGKKDQTLELSFWAMAEEPRNMIIGVCQEFDPWAGNGLWECVSLSNEWQKYIFIFNPLFDEQYCRLSFFLGHQTPIVYIDDVKLLIQE